MRRDEGNAPDHYLFPSFDLLNQQMCPLRQILTMHGYRYVDESRSKLTTFNLKKPALIQFFVDYIDEMRSQRGVCLWGDGPFLPFLLIYQTNTTNTLGHRRILPRSLFRGPGGTPVSNSIAGEICNPHIASTKSTSTSTSTSTEFL